MRGQGVCGRRLIWNCLPPLGAGEAGTRETVAAVWEVISLRHPPGGHAVVVKTLGREQARICRRHTACLLQRSYRDVEVVPSRVLAVGTVGTVGSILLCPKCAPRQCESVEAAARRFFWGPGPVLDLPRTRLPRLPGTGPRPSETHLTRAMHARLVLAFSRLKTSCRALLFSLLTTF